MAYRGLPATPTLAGKLKALVDSILKPPEPEMLDILRLRLPRALQHDLIFDGDASDEICGKEAKSMHARCVVSWCGLHSCRCT